MKECSVRSFPEWPKFIPDNLASDWKDIKYKSSSLILMGNYDSFDPNLRQTVFKDWKNYMNCIVKRGLHKKQVFEIKIWFIFIFSVTKDYLLEEGIRKRWINGCL